MHVRSTSWNRSCGTCWIWMPRVRPALGRQLNPRGQPPGRRFTRPAQAPTPAADSWVMRRIAIAGLLITSVLIPAVVTGLSSSARADVGAVSLPSSVTISQRTVSFSGTVQIASTSTGLRSASLWFRYPGLASASRIGTAISRRPGFLVVTASLDATRVTPGLNQLEVRDDADGDTRTILFDLRRQSRVMITHAEYRSDGRVALAVKVWHYDPKAGRFAPSKLSPVRLQERVDDRWVSVGQVTTGADGLAGALVPAGPGRHDYRAVRPDGATVRTATSKTIRTGQNFAAVILD
jgi:hypothetical protein